MDAFQVQQHSCMIVLQSYRRACNTRPGSLSPVHDMYQLVSRTLADSDCKGLTVLALADRKERRKDGWPDHALMA